MEGTEQVASFRAWLEPLRERDSWMCCRSTRLHMFWWTIPYERMSSQAPLNLDAFLCDYPSRT